MFIKPRTSLLSPQLLTISDSSSSSSSSGTPTSLQPDRSKRQGKTCVCMPKPAECHIPSICCSICHRLHTHQSPNGRPRLPFITSVSRATTPVWSIALTHHLCPSDANRAHVSAQLIGRYTSVRDRTAKVSLWCHCMLVNTKAWHRTRVAADTR